MSSRQQSLSIVEYFAEHSGYKCGYCGSEDTNFSHGMWAHTLTTQDYQDLIDRGWRRSGQYCYKPTMNKTCCPLYTIKCEALQFKPSKSQKKTVKRFINYILNDAKPGGSGTNDKTTNEDCDDKEDMEEVPNENIQERTEEMEKNLQLKDADMKVSTASLVEPHVTKIGEKTKSIEKMDIVRNSSPNIKNCDTKLEADRRTKHPLGMDPSKPKQGKAKLRRLEKWKAKHGDKAEVKPAKNQEKTIEDLLEQLETAKSPKHKWEIRLVPANDANHAFSSTIDETLKVYQKYQQVIHNDTPDKCTMRQFKRFLCNSPLQLDNKGPPHGSYHYQYCIDNKIVAVGVLDILPHCVSSVYLYYDPAYTFLSLGTLTSLLEICLVRKLARIHPNINQYYLGFYIHNCVKMKYKGRYSPSSLLCPEVFSWIPLPECIPLLDKSSYSRLDPDATKTDKDVVVDLGMVGVLHDRQATIYSLYQEMLREDGEDVDRDKEEVEEYSSFVGNTVAKRMLLYRS